MARYFDSGVGILNYLGPAQTIVQGSLVPIAIHTSTTFRLIDFTGLVSGAWRHANFGTLSLDGALFRLVFGPGNVPTRIRFGNPNDAYPNTDGGQWRSFNLPIPFGSFDSPLTAKTLAATTWLPR